MHFTSMVKVRRTTRTAVTLFAMVTVSVTLAAVAPTLGYAMGSAPEVRKRGRVWIDFRFPKEKSLFFSEDGTGKRWAVIGPYYAELSRVAAQTPENDVSLRGSSFGATVFGGPSVCPTPGAICAAGLTRYDALLVDDYKVVFAKGREAHEGVLERLSDGRLQVGRYRFTPTSSPTARALSSAVGCRVWVIDADTRPDTPCYLCILTSDLPITGDPDAGGVLRCGADPETLPPIARPSGTDWLACQRNQPQTRWYCKLRDTAQAASTTLPKSYTVGGIDLPVGEVFARELGKTVLLDPKLRFTLHWVDSPSCRRYALLNYPIDVYANNVWIGQVSPGRRAYEWDLARLLGPTGWSTSVAAAATTLTSSLKLASRYADPTQFAPVSPSIYLAQVPAECALAMTDVRLGFDAAAIRGELTGIEAHAQTLVELLAAYTVIHGQLLDATRGAMCAVDKVATATVDAVQQLTMQPVAVADLPLFSISSYLAISSALLEAQALGALPGDVQDPWQWYVDNHQAVAAMCGLSPVVIGPPSAEAFAQRSGAAQQQGIANATSYASALAQLRAIQTRAWALAIAGGISVNDARYQWMVPTP